VVFSLDGAYVVVVGSGVGMVVENDGVVVGAIVMRKSDGYGDGKGVIGVRDGVLEGAKVNLDTDCFDGFDVGSLTGIT
jgi:hypothetical protein